MMVDYTFDSPPDLIDEAVRLFSPREMADYLYNNYGAYTRDLQWEIETLQLDKMFEDFDSYEEYEAFYQSELFPDK